ncbi:MAG: hypothetical protein IJD56_02220 [Peptococcaceae bacterium]|nr:hypothetical protein [Peptococcaceae bacterium]
MITETHKQFEQVQMKSILAVFYDYLAGQQHIEFVWTEKFGLLYMTLWNKSANPYANSAFDVVQISSVEELCEVLMDVMVYNYLSESEQICLDENDIQHLYLKQVEPYAAQLPEYQMLLQSKFAHVLLPIKCKE